MRSGTGLETQPRHYYQTNKGTLAYVFTAKLEKTIRATLAHERSLSLFVEDGCDPLYADPFYAYNGYVVAFADITAYISRLLPEEQGDPLIVTLTRALKKRTQIAFDLAEARVKDGFAKRAQQMRASSNATYRIDDVER
ncbi:hypothetical protein RSAG8_01950, partial [Rhizoctonia solani AG-8 WAC10335]